MALTEFWPRMEACKKHRANVGTMQYGPDKPKLLACERCAKEDGKDLGVLIVDGEIRGPGLPNVIQQYLGEAINNVRHDLLKEIVGWTTHKVVGVPLTLSGETEVPRVEVLKVPNMRIEVKVIIGGAEEEEAKE